MNVRACPKEPQEELGDQEQGERVDEGAVVLGMGIDEGTGFFHGVWGMGIDEGEGAGAR